MKKILKIKEWLEDEEQKKSVEKVMNDWLDRIIANNSTSSAKIENPVLNILDGEISMTIKYEPNERPFVDPKTGNINIKYNPVDISEDYWIGIRG